MRDWLGMLRRGRSLICFEGGGIDVVAPQETLLFIRHFVVASWTRGRYLTEHRVASFEVCTWRGLLARKSDTGILYGSISCSGG